MAQEHRRIYFRNDKADKMPVAPGFLSLTSFTLKKIDDDESSDSIDLATTSGREAKMDSASEIIDAAVFKRSLWRRPWILQEESYHNQEDSEPKHFDAANRHPENAGTKLFQRALVLHPAEVKSSGYPEEAGSELHEVAPVFHPTEEEFTDSLKYIASIRPSVESFGICRIVPPPSWKVPCVLKEKNIWDHANFVTRVQNTNQPQNKHLKRKTSSLGEAMSDKRKRSLRGAKKSEQAEEDGFYSKSGPQFTLESFKKYSDSFKDKYFSSIEVVRSIDTLESFGKRCEPTLENIEYEFSRIVRKSKVIYSADVSTGDFLSGFPIQTTSDDLEYINSSWNLNNVPTLPCSLLSFESCDTSSLLVPWLQIGMCFSSYGWNVEEHHLYALCYMHVGDPKIWYAVPGRHATKFEAALKKYFPDLLGQCQLWHGLDKQLFSSKLKAEGIPVYQCIQNQGEFVVIFPGVYHAGLSSGFNCVEVVNFAPFDWLPHGQNAVERYREQWRKTSISHDKLLLGAAKKAVRLQWEYLLLGKRTSTSLIWKDACGKDGILAKEFKSRVRREIIRREYLCTSSQIQKMDISYDTRSKLECYICFDDLHLSAAHCKCSANRYACLYHAKQLCSCAWSEKKFLFRYETEDLTVLAEAVGSNLKAVHKWAKEHLGLSLLTYRNKYTSKDGGTSNFMAETPTSRIREELKARLIHSSSKLKAKESTILPTVKTSVQPSPSYASGEIGNRATDMVPSLHTFLTSAALSDTSFSSSSESDTDSSDILL